MTGEAWLLIAAGLAVGGVCAALVGAIGWHNGYAAAMHRATVRELPEPEQAFPPFTSVAGDAKSTSRFHLADASDPIEHFPAGWPDKTVMN